MVDDTVSRQMAIDAANRTDYRGLTVEDVKKVTDAVVEELKALPSAQPEWIPISEQMPKKAGNYLVTDHKGDIARFIFLDSKSSKDYWMRCVKAWMPLPKPYKEGG